MLFLRLKLFILLFITEEMVTEAKLNDLKERRKELSKKLRGTKKLLDALDELIKSAENGESLGRKKIKAKSAQMALITKTTKDILYNHDLGLKTKDLHHIVSVSLKQDIKYVTFRSLLSRLKKKEIEQDENRRWHIKI